MEVETLGGRLIAARTNAGIEQPEAAQLLTVQQPTLSRYEHNHRAPSIEFLRRAAELYGVGFGWLAAGIGNADPEVGGADNAAMEEKDTLAPGLQQSKDAGDLSADPTVNRLLGLLERFEADIQRALSVADKNADGVKTATETVQIMAADTHRLIERLPRHTGRVPGGAPQERAAE